MVEIKLETGKFEDGTLHLLPLRSALLDTAMPPPLPAAMNQSTAGPSSEIASSVDVASNNLSDPITDKPTGLRGLVQTALDSK